MFLPQITPLLGAALQRGDVVGFTFLLSALAMWGAAIFFLSERGQVPAAWKTSVLVSALITLIAGTNYAFMRGTRRSSLKCPWARRGT